jgi:putative chitinase
MYSFDRKVFFDVVRSQFGHLNTEQVTGFGKILDEWERRKLKDVRWLANMLAQSWHESAHTMQPVRERGDEDYLRGKPYYPWVGEGLIQVTWETNAKKFGAKKPGDLMTWPIALHALFDGMISGMFTGRKLSDYFDVDTDDPVNARRIVNGTDKAELIAGYHRKFLYALLMAIASEAHTVGASPTPAPTQTPSPPQAVAVAAPEPMASSQENLGDPAI